MKNAKRKQLQRGFRIAREFALYETRIRRPAEKRFVIFSRARSGSTTLAALLNNLPDVHCDGEILARALPFPERFIHARSAAKPCDVYGFKLLVSHAREIQNFTDRENLLHRLSETGFGVIHLVRDDRLAAAVSILRALRFGFHARMTNGPRLSREPIRIEFEELAGRLERIEGQARFMTRLLRDVPQIPVNYEADLANPAHHQRTVDRLCKELGTPSAPVQSPFAKIATGSLRDSVLNFDELERKMSETRWADLFAPHR
ncbi:MAG: hypothetical protein AB8G23_06430 [Myxococcota bacterium]